MKAQVGLAALALCFLGLPHVDALAAEATPNQRATFREAINLARSLPPGGVNDDGLIELGGIKQRVSVRGASRDNPILLFLHGGPGAAMLPLTWTYQRSWEDFFTVVHWDQRGAGRTSAINGRLDPTTTVADMQKDAEALIRHLLKTYRKDKLILMGHSWGSVLGVRIAQDHPELLYAYVGVGQVVDMRRNETQSYALTLAHARKTRNQAAIKELEAIAPYPGDGIVQIEKTGTDRKWVEEFGGMTYVSHSVSSEKIESLSPDYADDELTALKEAPQTTAMALWPALAGISFDDVRSFKVPVIIFAGRHDTCTPSQIAADWFKQIQAPNKQLFWFEKSAHYVVNEEPGIALYRLVHDVLPFAGPAQRHE